MTLQLFDFKTGKPLPFAEPALDPGAVLGTANWLADHLEAGHVALPGHPAGQPERLDAYSVVLNLVDDLLKVGILGPAYTPGLRLTGEPILTLFVASGRTAAQGARQWPRLVMEYGGAPALGRLAGSRDRPQWMTGAEHAGSRFLLPQVSSWIREQLLHIVMGWLLIEGHRSQSARRQQESLRA